MKRTISKIHGGLSWLVVVLIVIQFFLAGVGVFGADSYDAHRMNGSLILVGSLLLLILALVGRLGRERIGLSGILLVLMIIQSMLPSASPWIAAIHPVLGLGILGTSVQLARRGQLGGARQQAAAPAGTDAPRMSGERAD